MIKYICMMLIFNALAGQAETEWELLKDKDSISIYSSEKPGYKLKHFKATTLINKDADTILAALQDTQACKQWVHNCVFNKVVSMSDVRQRMFHTVIHSPLWFKDRDFYLQSAVSYQPNNQTFTIHFKAKPDYAAVTDDRVRITEIEMSWVLKQVTNNHTQVSYFVFIDPKLPFKSINHNMIKTSVFKTMQGLIELVENPKYAEIKYSAAELEMLTVDD